MTPKVKVFILFQNFFAKFQKISEYLNSAYAMNFSDETRDIRASTKRLMKEIYEPVPRARSVSRSIRASSVQPSYSR